MATDPCPILRANLELAERSDAAAQRNLEITTLAQRAAMETKGITSLLLQGARQALIDAGCETTGGYGPNDQQPTVDGIDTDLDMGEPR